MQIFDIVLIGIVLALDAFAVTIANCTTYSNLNRKHELLMAVSFAVFQFLMPVLGFYIGEIFVDRISAYSKYVCAGIFFVLATKIIVENTLELTSNKKEQKGESAKCEAESRFSLKLLFVQSVATSIDALAVGVSFTLGLNTSIFCAGAIIGIVTFALVYVAVFFGKLFKGIFGELTKWIGAVILMIIAIKNLLF